MGDRALGVVLAGWTLKDLTLPPVCRVLATDTAFQQERLQAIAVSSSHCGPGP